MSKVINLRLLENALKSKYGIIFLKYSHSASVDLKKEKSNSFASLEPFESQ